MTTNTPHNAKQPLSRREFLYYLGGGSLALVTAGTCAGIMWYATTNDEPFQEVTISLDRIPTSLLDPVSAIAEAQCYLALTDAGLLALNGDCTFEGDTRSVIWISVNNRFECSQCGSKYRLDGTYIEGPAPRELDRFAFRVTTSDGTVLHSTDGSPINVPDAVEIVIETRHIILGTPH